MAPFDPAADPLQVVAAAVSPVVMISATAILIAGVNSRYISISDRVRNLAREYRSEGTVRSRALNIHRQMRVFHHRLHLVSWATRVLYSAVFCFVCVALLITMASLRHGIQSATLALFLLGLALIAGAILLQLIELQESNTTIYLESQDVLEPPEKNGEAMRYRG